MPQIKSSRLPLKKRKKSGTKRAFINLDMGWDGMGRDGKVWQCFKNQFEQMQTGPLKKKIVSRLVNFVCARYSQPPLGGFNGYTH